MPNTLGVCGGRLLPAAIVGILGFSNLDAQQRTARQAGPQQPRTVMVTQWKTAQGKSADYRKFVETSWKKFAQVGVDDGRNVGAIVLRLIAPYATGAPADYQVVTFPAKNPNLAGPDRAVGEAAAKKAGFASLQAYLDMTNGIASPVKSDWLNTFARVGSVQAGNFMRVARYMTPADAIQAETEFLRDYALPLNTFRVKEGARGLVGWGVTRPMPMLMSTDEAGFTTSISAIFKDADSIWAGPGGVTEAEIKASAPTLTLQGYLNRNIRVNQSRKPVTTRIWEVVAMVGKAPQITPP